MTRIAVVGTLLLLAWPATGEAGLAGGTGANAGRVARAELRVFPMQVGITQMPRVVLVNTGEVTVETSYIYKLEQKTLRGWRWINRRQAWILPLIFLGGGESTRPQPIGIWRVNTDASRCARSREPCCTRVLLRPGLYRVTKAATVVTNAETRRPLVVRATFRVLTPRTPAPVRPEVGY